MEVGIFTYSCKSGPNNQCAMITRALERELCSGHVGALCVPLNKGELQGRAPKCNSRKNATRAGTLGFPENIR